MSMTVGWVPFASAARNRSSINLAATPWGAAEITTLRGSEPTSCLISSMLENFSSG
jgi:hypothetical protein